MLVAARLFREKSFLATILDDTAAELGINRVTIYPYYKGKEQLLYEILTRVLEEHIGSVGVILCGDASRLEKMESLIRARLCIGAEPSRFDPVSMLESKHSSQLCCADAFSKSIA